MSFSRFQVSGKHLPVLALGVGAAGVIASLAVTAEAQAPRLLAPQVSANGQLSFADLVERVSPAVVSVLTEREVRASPLSEQLPEELREMFRFRFGLPDGGGDDDFSGGRRQNAQGSGFFVDASGHIVTNNHVVDGADEITVRLNGGKTLKATLVGSDPLTDLAVLKVDPPQGQAFVQFADDVRLRVGDWVVAVGNPYGLSGTVTAGIVSAIGGEGRDGQFLDFIQIDAPINRGNSGGPTFDLKGRVVGVNTAIYSETGGSVGIGFAIPASVAKQTVAQLIKNGSVTRGFLGVSSLQNVTEDLAAALGRKTTNGVLVGDVVPESPAAKAGIEPQDIVVAVNGAAVNDVRELTRRVAALPPGSKTSVKIIRNGAERNFQVTLQERPSDGAAPTTRQPAPNEDSLSSELGLRVTELSQSARAQFRVPDGVSGVVITGVKPDSPAEDAGLRAGMVILQADGKAVTSGTGLRRLVEEAKKAGKEAILIRHQYGDVKQFSALPLK
ncbi:MAG: Do family serine endopeptidase [Parvularculaceae bacterium]|nr:Do family serine endopeptidase [Parvularculaceae bacterium]